jgi:predicted permease
VDPGFRSEGLVTVELDLRRPHYSKERLPVIYRELLERFSARPGVVSAVQVAIVPVSGSGWNERARGDGSQTRQESHFNRVGPGFFRTLGTPIVAGRDFDQRDAPGAAKVAIVNEAFVRRFFGNANPVGRSFIVDGQAGKPDPVYQVVGVARNTKYYELREDFIPTAFLPMSQEDDPGAGATYMLRISAPLGDIFSGAKAAVAEVHPEIGIQFQVMTTQIKDSLTRDRLMATLSGAFGLLAGLLATLGLYGVISYMVARRRNEIGVRMALGADRRRVVRLVLREAGLLLVVGLIIGAGLALWAGKAASALLFGLKPDDPMTLGGAIALLAAVALLASYAPARRASRIEPMHALRDE